MLLKRQKIILINILFIMLSRKINSAKIILILLFQISGRNKQDTIILKYNFTDCCYHLRQSYILFEIS